MRAEIRDGALHCLDFQENLHVKIDSNEAGFMAQFAWPIAEQAFVSASMLTFATLMVGLHVFENKFGTTALTAMHLQLFHTENTHR